MEVQIQNVLVELEELLRRWGIGSSDWVLVSQYAYRLLGYDVRVREGHLNLLVRRNKIPWRITEGVEIHPPRGSKYREDFEKFIKKTGFDFDINLASDEEFEAKTPHFVLYALSNTKKIRIQTPSGAIKEYEKLLALSTKEGFGVERLDKDIFYVKDMIKALTGRKEENTIVAFQKLLAKYELEKAKIKQLKPTPTKYIRGIVASKGKAVGKAVVVHDIDDARNLKDGNVLVTKMTFPALIVMMPKVSAIITDEGGMLSHSAILAREIGVPCIVGTQVATKLIRNDDLVEVDAYKGVVRKVK